ncbi:MAG: trehalose-phosphatase [Actinomycetales bacterium]
MVPDDVVQAVRAFAARPHVLVALDFDGVLSPLVDDPNAARALPGTVEAVLELARLPDTDVVLVSGRALESLSAVSGVRDGDGVSLVGSHGAEASLRQRPTGRPASIGMTREEGERLEQVTAALRTIAATDPGLDVELKPTGSVLHTRRAADDVARRAEDEALRGPGSWPGVHAIRGKSVVELAVVETSKGAALQRLRADLGVPAVLYAGDDVTDETAFSVLGPGDVGVKVGPGATHAAYRVDGPEDVRELIQRLVAERSQR